MYFIVRNNKIYSYIAHTSSVRRYGATLGAVCFLYAVGMYLIYSPLVALNRVHATEQIMLQKQYDERRQIDRVLQELSASIELGKKNMSEDAIGADKRQEHCHQRMLFLLNTIAQQGMRLNGYGSCREKDKNWYTKDSARFDIAGTLQQLMTFLETINNAQKLMTISHVTITRGADDLFQMVFDCGLIAIKK